MSWMKMRMTFATGWMSATSLIKGMLKSVAYAP